MKKKAIVPFLLLLGTIFSKAQTPSFTISPNTGKVDEALTVKITGNNTTFGKDGSCIGSNCSDLGASFFFNMGTITMQVPYESVNLIDSNRAALIDIVLPDISGTWQLSTASGLQSSNNFVIKSDPVIVKSIDISPTIGIEGKPLTVTITGTNINLVHNGSCENCLNIGNAMYFRQSSLTAEKIVPFQSVNVLDSNHVEVSVILPEQNFYSSVSIGGMYAGQFNVLESIDDIVNVSMSPVTAEVGKTIKISLSSNEVNFGYNGSCSGPNCRDLGTKFFFGATAVNFQSVNIIDSNHAEVLVTVPNYEGTFEVRTETRLEASQNFVVTPKPLPSISLTPNVGIVGKPLMVTITGNNTHLGYQGSCSGDDCFDIGDHIFMFTNATLTNRSIYYESVSVVDSNHIEVSIVLPPNPGIYYTEINTVYSSLFTVKEDAYIKHFTISPNTAEAGKTVKLIVSSDEINFGYNGSCVGTNCRDLGSELLFDLGSKSIQSVNLIDSNHAEVLITVPSYTGSYAVKTTTGLESAQRFTVTAKPYPSITVSKNTGFQGELLTVTITGNNTNLGYNGSCAGSNCIDIGNSVSFFTQSSLTTKVIPIQSVNVIDSNHIDISLILPSTGTYKLGIGNVNIAGDFEVVTLAKAVLSGTQTTCNSYATLYVKFSGTAPWSFVWESTNGNRKSYSAIINPDFSFNVDLSETQTYTIIEANDANGPCQISGSATVTPKERLSADLQHSYTTDPKTYVLTLTGQSPWVVTISNNGQIDSLLVTENVHTFSVAEATSYSVYLVNVRDANCTNGSITGLVGIITTLETENLKAPIDLYPNPSSGTVHVEEGTTSIYYNSMGEEVYRTTQSTYDLGDLSSGIYSVHLSKNNRSTRLKFIKE